MPVTSQSLSAFCPPGTVLAGWPIAPMAPGPPTPQVVVISDNPETIDGLQAYFAGVGIHTRSSRTFKLARALRPGMTALVVFPDELPLADVVEGLAAVREQQPWLLLLLVTAHPQRFAALSRDGHAVQAIVLPKPVFGWTIVDAIRLHAEGLS